MLMLALPHHLPLLGNATHTVVGGGGHRTIRGFAPGVLTTGNKWVRFLRCSSVKESLDVCAVDHTCFFATTNPPLTSFLQSIYFRKSEYFF